MVLVWGSVDGAWCIPVGFRLWRPKRSCAPRHERTKLELASELVTTVVAAQLPVSSIVFDTQYTARWFTKRVTRLGLLWQGTLDPKTHGIWRGTNQAVRDVAPRLRLKWRKHLGARAVRLKVVAPQYGELHLVVVNNRHGNWAYLVRTDQQAALTTLVRRKRRRWSGETMLRDTKQYAGLEACQCWVDQALVRHVALVLVTFVVAQQLRKSDDEPVAAVKERWQLTVLRDGELKPVPLRASPSQLRATA